MSPASGDVPSTIAEVLAKRDAALAELDAKARLMEDEKQAIQARARAQKRNLTPEESANFVKLNEALDVFGDARVEIKLIAVDDAVQSQEAKDLADSLAKVNGEVKKKLDHVANISQQLKKVAEVLASIQSIVSALTRLAALVV